MKCDKAAATVRSDLQVVIEMFVLTEIFVQSSDTVDGLLINNFIFSKQTTKHKKRPISIQNINLRKTMILEELLD